MEQNALIGRLQKKRNDLSELEKRVLDFILNDYELIANLSIDDIANKSFVSTATVSRCSQKLGYQGYRELKYALLQKMNGEHPSLILLKNTNSEQTKKYIDLFLTIQKVSLFLKVF